MLLLFVSCLQESMEEKITDRWGVQKMQRNIGGSYKDVVINPKMSFEFDEKGGVKIVTHFGQTIKGTWSFSKDIKTILLTAENETKSFLVDSLKGNKLYITSNDVKFQLIREPKKQ